jgi:hypothetical protein
MVDDDGFPRLESFGVKVLRLKPLKCTSVTSLEWKTQPPVNAHENLEAGIRMHILRYRKPLKKDCTA